MKAGLKAAAVLAAAALVVSIPTGASAATGDWTVARLPMPDAYPADSAIVVATDGHGTYSGWIRTEETGPMVTTWTKDSVEVIGRPAGFEVAQVDDQNNAGTIVGSAFDRDTFERLVYTLQGKEFTFLPLPAGFTQGHAMDINDRGDVLGAAQPENGPGRNVLWPADDPDHPVLLDFGLAARGLSLGGAPSLDEDRTVVLPTSDGPFLWRDGTLTALTLPAGVLPNWTSGAGIRNGQVVSHTWMDGAYVGVLWTAPDQPVLLPGSRSAHAVNASGLILGFDQDGAPSTWQGTRPAGRLPVPGDAEVEVRALGDDGTLAGNTVPGRTIFGEPLVWTRSS